MFFYERIKIRKLLLINIILSVVIYIGIGIYEHSVFLRVDKNLINLFIYLGMLLWFIVKARKTENTVSDFVRGYKEGFSRKETSLVILFHFIVTIGFIFIILLIVSYIDPNLMDRVLYNEDMIIPQDFNSKIYYAITAVILAPIIEEIVFRGIILNRFRTKWGIGKAIILSSVLFGILHYELAVTGALTLGICLALIYLRTENILVPITIHFINNLIATAFMFLPSENTGTVESFTLQEARLIGWSVGVPLIIVSLIFFIKYYKKNWPQGRSKRKALLVVDMQQAFFSLKDKKLYRPEILVNNVSRLIESARESKIPVIYIQHSGNKGSLLERGSDTWSIHESIKRLKNDIVIHKKTVDPFTRTTLKKELEFMNAGEIIVTGLQTEYSIDSACRYAAGLGYRVTLVSDAHSTFDSNILNSEQIITHHNKILSDYFVRLNSTEEIIGKIQ